MAQAVVEGLGRLARERAARFVRDGAGDHDGQFDAILLEDLLAGEDGGLGIQGVEDGLDQQQVDAALDKTADGLLVDIDEPGEGDVAVARVVDIRRDRQGPARRSKTTGDETRFLRRAVLVGGCACEFCRLDIDLVCQLLHLVVGLGGAGRVEAVGLDDIRADLEIGLVDAADHIGLREHEQVVVALDVPVPVGKALAAVIRLLELVLLDHGAHGAIENQDAFVQQLSDLFGCSYRHGGERRKKFCLLYAIRQAGRLRSHCCQQGIPAGSRK